MGRRTVGVKGRYLVHAGRTGDKYKKGQIIDNQDLKRCISQDKVNKAKKVVPSGYGHLGDQKKREKKKTLY